ncbi:MAG: winged helix-turn-helix domain-containing protein [Thioalkalivibrionaceae bacterium]
MRILLIEDDAKTADYVVRGLREERHTVDHLSNGAEGLARATQEAYDVLIIDRMLPGLDGITALRALRAAGVHTPALFLTALGGLNERIEGFHAGGDDYLPKPFAYRELSARVMALGRRYSGGQTDPSARLECGDLSLDLLRRHASRSGETLNLLPREFTLLEHLMRHKGRIQTRTMLLEAVWGLHFDPQTNVVETHISRLRAKVDKPFDTALIETVRGAGYRIRDPA